MKQISEQQVKQYEEQLKNAMLKSDVVSLEKLLSSDLIFTNHLGQLMSREDDLNVHRSGKLKIEKIDFFDQKIISYESVSIVSVRTKITGNFGGQLSESNLRFTRVWGKISDDDWIVIAAHSSLIC